MDIQQLIDKLSVSPELVEFDEVMQVIADHYEYTPARFTNGGVVNEAGTNEGSCKLFFFAQKQGLDQQQTLNCFGHYYREDVMGNPDSTDHMNIRQFMKTGWQGIKFFGEPLQ